MQNEQAAGAPPARDSGRAAGGRSSGAAGTLFGALADPTRRRVVELLGSGPRRAGDLANAAGMSAPAMSRHLRVLLAAGVIVDERVPSDARLRVFRLRPESLVAMQAWLDQLQAHWSEQLGAFGQHVGRRVAAAEEPGDRA